MTSNMNKYYERPKHEIIGFYCFVADKPKEEVKPRKRQGLKLQSFVRSLLRPEYAAQTKSYPQFV